MYHLYGQSIKDYALTSQWILLNMFISWVLATVLRKTIYLNSYCENAECKFNMIGIAVFSQIKVESIKNIMIF